MEAGGAIGQHHQKLPSCFVGESVGTNGEHKANMIASVPWPSAPLISQMTP